MVYWDERLNRLSKRTDIKIYGRVKANEYVSKAAMVASTIHEFGHASHFQSVLSTPGSDRNKIIKGLKTKWSKAMLLLWNIIYPVSFTDERKQEIYYSMVLIRIILKSDLR